MNSSSHPRLRRLDGEFNPAFRLTTCIKKQPLTHPYRKINTSPNTVEDPAILKLHLSKPPVKRIDLHFPLGKEVTARNLKGVTIKDALDAIHKAYKKRVCLDL